MHKLLKNGMKNICLMGLMGSGKSIIGKKLAEDLDILFFDTDTEIMNKTKKSINYIFDVHGERYFREIEENICLKILHKNNCIISLGGGSILSSKVRKKIKNNSYSIYLKVDLDILYNRIKNNTKRPLLKNENIKNKLLSLYNDRKKFYEDADCIIENNIDFKRIVKNIKEEIK